MSVVSFVGGLLVGATLGALTLALCISASEGGRSRRNDR
jgi:hypothetical protein